MDTLLTATLAIAALGLLGGCSNGDSNTDGSGGAGNTTSSSSTSSNTSTSSGGGGAGGDGGGAVSWNAGNPDGACGSGVPAGGQPVDTSNPTTVVGTGTPASCGFDTLRTAIQGGGIITFNCGGAVTIPITATIAVPTDVDTVIDGGRRVTLDGQHQVAILRFDNPNFQANEHRLTLQHIALVNGKTTPTEAIPQAPAPCSQGFNDGEGGAVYMRDGNLTVIDSIFTGHQGAPLGPDTGGGAIYVLGSKHGALIVGSTFEDNHASNAGAVGGLFTELDIYDSLFRNNGAVGHDANNNDPNQCSQINNGQNEIGSGGNGGAIYSDGNSVDVRLCGDQIVDNAAGANAFGGGLFFTSNNFQGDLYIIDTTITGNTGGHWTNAATGSINNAGTAVGTNCHSITIQNSTVQGYP